MKLLSLALLSLAISLMGACSSLPKKEVSHWESLKISSDSEEKGEEEEEEGDYATRALSLCYRGKFRQGLDLLDGGYPLSKKNPRHWNQVGNCYLLQGKLQLALLFYNKARDLNPRYVPAINNLGVIYRRQGRDQEALLSFKKARKLNPRALTPLFNLAQLYLQYGRTKKARALYFSLYKRNGQDKDVLNGLATCYLLQGQVDKALSFFEALPEDSFEHPTISLNYSAALALKGRKKEAKSMLLKIDGLSSLELREYKEDVLRFSGGGQ